MNSYFLLLELIVPQPEPDENEKLRHRITKGRKNEIGSVVSKYGTYETNRESRTRNRDKDTWVQNRHNQKNKHTMLKDMRKAAEKRDDYDAKGINYVGKPY